MQHPRVFLFGVLLTVAIAAAVLSGQQTGTPPQPPPQERPTFRGSTALVQVDVVVTDSVGQPVTGLAARDFVLLDRGKPQRIDAFEEVSHEVPANPFAALPASVPVDVASNTSAQASRLVVLVLDDLNIWSRRSERVKALARRIVNDLGSDASMAVLFTSGDHGTEITSQRAALLTEIDKFKGWHRLPMRTRLPRTCSGSELKDPEFWNADRLVKATEQVARMLGGEASRRKAFVVISEGIVRDIHGLFDVMAEIPCPMGSTYVPQHDIALLNAMESMRRANVATYTIDPAAMLDPTSVVLPEDRDRVEAERRGDVNYKGFSDANPPGPDAAGEGELFLWDRPSFLAREYLTEVAAASGGFSIVSARGFDDGFKRLLTDLDHYYLLGFYPADPKNRDYHPLEVRVNYSDVRVRYRRGYRLGDVFAAPRNKNAMAALSAGAMPQATLPLRMHAAPLVSADRAVRVPVTLELTVPRTRVQDVDDQVRDEIQYAVLAIDLASKKVKEAEGRGARVALRPRDPAQPPPEHVTYQVSVPLELAPGRYQLRGSIRSERLGDGGSVYLPLDVPDFAASRLALSAIVVGYFDGARVAAPPPRVESARGRGAPGRSGPVRPPPPPFAGLPFTPTLDREFTPGDDLLVYFEVHRRDRARQVTLAVVLVDVEGRVVRRHPNTMPAENAGRITMALPLAGLAPGPFRLRVSASDGVNDTAREMAIAVR